MPNVLPFEQASFNSSIAMCDTSFIGNLLGVNSNSSLQQECQDTLLNMIRGKTIAIVSVFTGTELSGMYLRNEYRKIFSGVFTQKDIKELKQNNLPLYKKTVEAATINANLALKAILETKPFWDELLPITNETFELANKLQLKYQFPGFADALQLASAINEEAAYFLTTDKDFCNINEPNIQVLVDYTTFAKNS